MNIAAAVEPSKIIGKISVALQLQPLASKGWQGAHNAPPTSSVPGTIKKHRGSVKSAVHTTI